MADEIKITALPAITNASLTDVAPVVQSGVTYQESNQEVLDLFKQQIAFQRNNDYTPIDLTSADAFLSNPAATTFLVTGQPNDTRSISLPVSNASNSWPRGTNSIYFINDGDYDVTIKYASGSGLATLKAHGIVQLALINNSTSNGVFAALQPLQATNDLSDLDDITTARSNLGLGSVATKNISNTGYSTVPAVITPVTANVIPIFSGDEDGTITDGGVTLGQVLKTYNNLNDVESISDAQTNLQITGTQNTAIKFRPASTNPATASQTSTFTNGVDLDIMTFAETGTHVAMAQIPMPKRWDGGNINLLIPWYSDVSDAGTVVWNAAVAIIDSDGIDLNSVNFGTTASVETILGGGINDIVNYASITGITNTGDFFTSNPALLLKLWRDGGSGDDNFAGPAIVVQTAQISWNAIQGNDA